MTGDEMHTARATLAKLWGLPKPLTYDEMGRALRLGGQRPDQSIRDYERGKTAVSGPLSLALEALLSGWRPADLATVLPALATAPSVAAAHAKPKRMTMDDVRPVFVSRLKQDKPKR